MGRVPGTGSGADPTAAFCLQVASDPGGEVSLAGRVDRQNTVLGHDGVELLLFVRNSGRQWGQVPVQMRVALPAAEAHRVHALRGQGGRDGTGNRSHGALKSEKLIFGEVLMPVLDMSFRSDQTIAEQSGKPGQEGYRVVILVDEVVPIVGMAGQVSADETGALTDTPGVRREIERSGSPLIAHSREE